MADDPILGPLLARGEHQTLDFPTSSLGEIIHKPFVRIGVDLEPDLTAALRQKILDFAREVISSSQGEPVAAGLADAAQAAR